MKIELYNCHRIDERHYKMTKFDNDLNPMYSAQRNAEPRLCSYVCSTDTCDCPAGEAKSCRHRKMLNIFISNKKIDTGYFFDYVQHSWYRPPCLDWEDEPLPVTEQNFEGSLLDPKVLAQMKAEHEGGATAPASEAPSPQPSARAYRRF